MARQLGSTSGISRAVLALDSRRNHSSQLHEGFLPPPMLCWQIKAEEGYDIVSFWHGLAVQTRRCSRCQCETDKGSGMLYMQCIYHPQSKVGITYVWMLRNAGVGHDCLRTNTCTWPGVQRLKGVSRTNERLFIATFTTHKLAPHILNYLQSAVHVMKARVQLCWGMCCRG